MRLAIVIVSANSGRWLDPCLSSVFAHAGAVELDVVVVDNECTDETVELVRTRFPRARVVSSRNHGFGYGNNRGLQTTTAPYVLFLNPDTEVMAGTFGELVSLLERRPDVGLAGVRQMGPDGALWPSMRRFPSAARALSEALLSERWPLRAPWAGERVLDTAAYDRETECDWTSGSFMLVRRAALASAGLFDERFFIYCEEPDLCLRIKQAGWRVVHLPQMTILHHAGKGGVQPRLIAQDAFARRQYARKHFGFVRRCAYLLALIVRHLLRGAAARAGGSERATRRTGAWRALRALLGGGEPPFRTPPPTAFEGASPPLRAHAGPSGERHADAHLATASRSSSQ